MLKRILLGFAAFLLLLVVAFLIIVGPWPTYADSKYRDSKYYAKALADITEHAAASEITTTPGRLQVGWAYRVITPRIGIPLAGYGARGMNHKSTGVRDELFVKVMAFSDGKDTAVLVGADMLITPPNLALMVRERVAAEIPLTGDDILFNASHTHCGPGGLGEGLAMRVTAAQYAAEVPELLATAFTEAIVEAYQNLKPGKIANGSVQAPEFIRNRTRKDGPTDPELSFLVAEQDNGDRCYLVSYSAHPTNFGDEMLEFSAEYPGALRKTLAKETGAETVYLGGAVGSMGPRAPEAPTPGERVDAMGGALGRLVLDATKELNFRDSLDVTSMGVSLDMPPIQLRPIEGNPNWRLSPFIARLAFAPNELNGWLQGVRVGDLLFMGMPCDFSGEISIEWKAWAAQRKIDLWTLSFCGTYCGYFSPDKYYLDLPLSYETGLMSWFGPNIEAYFTDLFHHTAGALSGGIPGDV
jgi:neutral ceramidase